jgi:hypothetical protein
MKRELKENLNEVVSLHIVTFLSSQFLGFLFYKTTSQYDSFKEIYLHI